MIRGIYEEALNEDKADKLKPLFMDAIDKVDENLSYKDLALTIANIIKDEYGTHNYKPFIEVLKKELK